MKRLRSWRLALRIARRDALRAKGRSILVIAMIALPILGVSAADLALRSAELSTEEELTRRIGQADARYKVAQGGRPLFQHPLQEYFLPADEREELDHPDDEDVAAVDVESSLPAGATVLTDSYWWVSAHSENGLLQTEFREIDATDPLTEGMLVLKHGRYPRQPDEVAVTEWFLAESGLSIGSELELRDIEASFRITGAYELPSQLRTAQVIAQPGAALHLLDRDRGWSQHATSHLVAVPGGVDWDQVMKANTQGLIVESRVVHLDPPPDHDVPMFQHPDHYEHDTAVDATTVAVVGTVVALVILEICLLAGPAFAVGARRSRRQLGLVGANGGDRRQLRAIMLSSGIVLGAAAAVIGVALGIVLTLALRPLIEAQAGTRFGAWDFRATELLAIAALGLLTGLLAAVIPAVTAARNSVLDSLNGRRGVRGASRLLPVCGAAALLLGSALALVGGLTMDNVQVVALGAVVAELGLVAMTPMLVGALGRLGRWLPLSGRLALRDAVRNRGRTAPAVAAVLAAVAGTVAVATYIVSDDARQEAEYVARLPHGGIAVIVSGADQLSSLHRTRELVEEEFPTAERADTLRIVPGERDCGVWYDGMEETDGCGRFELAIPAGKECPLGAEDQPRDGRPEYSDEEIRSFFEDGRCADPAEGWWAYRMDPPVLVAGPELLSVLEISDPGAERALAAGRPVVFDRKYFFEEEEQLVLRLYDYPSADQAADQAAAEEADVQREPVRTETLDAYLSDDHAYGLIALLPPAAASDAGLTTVEVGSNYSTEHLPTSAERQAFDGAIDAAKLEEQPATHVEVGHESETGIELLILALFAMVITLGAAGIATGLAQADSEADLSTLAAVGAAPRVRRTLSGLQCGLIAVLGVLLGVVSGVIPAAGLRLAEYRVQLLWWEQARTHGGWGEMIKPELYLELPWMTFLQLIVVVPVVAGLLAAMLTRSRVALARRAG